MYLGKLDAETQLLGRNHISTMEDLQAYQQSLREQKEMLKDPSREFHLYVGEGGEYELHEWKQLAVAGGKSTHARAFVFERGGRRVVAYWHTSGSGTLVLRDGTRLDAGPMRYWSSSLSLPEVERAFLEARLEEPSAQGAP